MGSSANAAGGLAFKEAVEFFRAKLSLPTASWTDIWQGMHARAFVVAGAMQDNLLADLRGAVQKAIKDGTTLAEFRKDFDAIVEKTGWKYTGGRNWRTRIIYETNLRTAYQAGRYKQQQAIKHRRPYWQYKHSPHVADPRPEHLAWDGLIIHADDPWWDTHYPPNGWGCRCSVRTLAERDLKRMGKKGPDKAPPINIEEKLVGSRGPNPRAVKVPRGIDPGWAYNVGKAAWGETKAARLAGETAKAKQIRLTPGDWKSHGRPGRLPLRPLSAPLGPPVKDTAAMVNAITETLGDQSKTYTLTAGGFRYPVQIHATVLGEHLADLKRAPFITQIPGIIDDPEEVWLAFEQRSNGQIVLRVRMLKVIGDGDGKGRGYMLVLDANQGRLVGHTFMPYEARKIKKVREGQLIYAKEE